MLERGRAEFAAVANAIAEFEPVTVVCANTLDVAGARAALSARVDIAIHAMDGSWLRDNGPIFITDGARREARHFKFNGWGERHALRDRDAALGAILGSEFADAVQPVDVVLEGGAIAVNGAGTIVTTEGCVMHALRNWQHSKHEVEDRILKALGATRVIWLAQGLEEDLDRTYGTDGHIDLFFDFVSENRCLLLSVPYDDINYRHLTGSKEALHAAGIEVIDFPYMSSFKSGDRRVIAPYLNFYACNGAVIVPVAGEDTAMDRSALALIREHFPGRQVVGVRMRAALVQGGAIHCLTQQIPARKHAQ
jgi:agmatine deiminase